MILIFSSGAKRVSSTMTAWRTSAGYSVGVCANFGWSGGYLRRLLPNEPVCI